MILIWGIAVCLSKKRNSELVETTFCDVPLSYFCQLQILGLERAKTETVLSLVPLFPVFCHPNQSPPFSSCEWWTNYKLGRPAEKIEKLQTRKAYIFFYSFIISPGCGFIPGFHRAISLSRRTPVWQSCLMNESEVRINSEGASKP